MSLKDGKKKMSKSDPSEFSRINLTDKSDVIIKKILKAKTDSDPFPKDESELENRPEIDNLINIFSAFEECNKTYILNNYAGKDFKKFKEDLCEVINKPISKISKEMAKLLNDQDYINSILLDGQTRAQEIALENINTIKKIIGFSKI